jgi:demethylmenaquinone methyltransferase/2-methoxy-6-polyprenyl-1,4-benzoquinol methylase
MRYRDEQTRKIEAVLKMIPVNFHDRVLDAGCGTGLLLDHISGKVQMIVGLDISREMLKHTKERVNNSKNAHLILADVDSTPIRKGFFSFAFAFTLIQNMPSPSITLRKITAVMMEKANLIITGLKSIYSREEFEKILSDAGLKLIKLTSKYSKYHVAICRNVPF